MRTTLTIDDDVAKLVDHEIRRTGDSFKETVNRLLLLGLMTKSDKTSCKPFEIRAIPMGIRSGMNYDSIPELLEELEGPYHR